MLTPGQIRSLWMELGRLHGAGLSHQRIDLDRVALPGDDTAAFSTSRRLSEGCMGKDYSSITAWGQDPVNRVGENREFALDTSRGKFNYKFCGKRIVSA